MIRCISFGQLSKAEFYNKIDNKIFLFSKKSNLTIDSITSFVNNNFNTNEEKVRAYYTFISLTISYDVKRLEEITLQSAYGIQNHFNISLSQYPEEVLKTKKGVCEGISLLMVKLCEGSKIKCQSVGGYTKSNGEFIQNILHAWNAVEIDSTWQLIDITWSNGYVNSKNEFVKQFSDRYYLTLPSIFISDHLPLDPMWQLRSNPFTKKYFQTNDKSKGKYYALNYNFVDSINSFFRKTKSEKELTELIHCYNFDTINLIYKRNIDVFINNKAAESLNLSGIYFEEYIDFYKNTLSKQPTKKNCAKAFELLNNSKAELIKTDAYLKNKTAYTHEFTQNFKLMEENVSKNKTNLDKNFAFLKQLRSKVTK